MAKSNMTVEELVPKNINSLTANYPAFMPIFGAVKVCYTDKVKTLGIDKYCRLAINKEWVLANKRHLLTILLHEILHIFFQHHNIMEKYNFEAKIFNIAGDIHINSLINKSRFILPEGYLEAKMYDLPEGKSAEEYYYLLEDKPKKITQGYLGVGDMLTDEDIQKELDKICPDHVSTEELNESVQDTYRKCAEGEGCGNMVSELTAFAREMLKPKVNWRTVLQNAVRTAETTEYKIREKDNYKRPSRRTKWGGGVILPKKAGQKLNIVMSFDTSGSISHELVNQFMAEVKRALQFSEIKKCYLWNTSVYWSGSEKDMQRHLENIFQSGGTDGECLIEIGEDIKADLFIHMTDGYFTYPEKVRGKHIAIEWDNNEIKKVRKV